MVPTCIWCWLFALVSRVSWILLSQDWDSDGQCYMYLMLTLCSCFTCLLNSAISGLRLWWSLHVLDADSLFLFDVSPEFCYLRIETLMVPTCIWCWLFALVSRVSWILLSQDWDSDGHYMYLMLTLCSCFTCLLNSAISGLRLWWSLHVFDADSLLLFHVSPEFCYLRIETLMVSATCIWCWLFALVSRVSWILLSQDWDSDGHYMYLMLTLCSCFMRLLNSAISGLRLWWSLHVLDAESLFLFDVSPEFCSLRIETLMVTTCTWCWLSAWWPYCPHSDLKSPHSVYVDCNWSIEPHVCATGRRANPVTLVNSTVILSTTMTDEAVRNMSRQPKPLLFWFFFKLVEKPQWIWFLNYLGVLLETNCISVLVVGFTEVYSSLIDCSSGNAKWCCITIFIPSRACMLFCMNAFVSNLCYQGANIFSFGDDMAPFTI